MQRLDVRVHAADPLSGRWRGMSKRILVVEDREADRQIIRDMLAGTDYEISESP
jgi:hypothetical protein